MDVMGLMRQMHSVLYLAASAVVLGGLVVAILHHLTMDKEIRRTARKVYMWLILIILLIIVGNVLRIASSNSVPRNAADRSDIYQQVEKNRAQ